MILVMEIMPIITKLTINLIFHTSECPFAKIHNNNNNKKRGERRTRKVRIIIKFITIIATLISFFYFFFASVKDDNTTIQLIRRSAITVVRGVITIVAQKITDFNEGKIESH